MQVLHITDPHLYGDANGCLRGVETDSSLRHVMEAALSPDADPGAPAAGYSVILVTGDLVQDDPSGYARFKNFLGGQPTPVLCVPGNHDEPEAMQRSLDVAPFRYCGTHTFGEWQFVMLDSYDQGQVGGRLNDAELARLDSDLGRSRAHALVCLHHHPIAMGSRWLDGSGLANHADFWRIIDAHPHVRGVVWGHVHQVYEGERHGVRLFATPSTGAQFLPHTERYAIDSRPPAYRHLDLRPNGAIETEVRWVKCA